MIEYTGNKYAIDFDHFRSDPKPVHYTGRIYVYSNQEIPLKSFYELLDEIEINLPKGITSKNFKETLYNALEEKGLYRFRKAKDHGLMRKIKYEKE